MKYLLLLSALAGGMVLNAQAQGIYHFEDPTFDNESLWTTTGGSTLPKHFHSFESATGKVLDMGQGSSPKPEKVTGYGNSGWAVQIKSVNIRGLANANGNITTGRINMGSITATDASNMNYTSEGYTIAGAAQADANNYKLAFAGIPDKVTCMAKFKAGTSKASGTTPNAQGMFIIHDDSNKKTFTWEEGFLFKKKKHVITMSYKDPDGSNEFTSNKFGEAALKITPCADWTKFEAEFTYPNGTNKKAENKYYLLASFTTNPIPGDSKDDILVFDEVRFEYYNTLKSLSYDGANIQFNEETTSYDLSTLSYDKSKLHYQVKGAGAKATVDDSQVGTNGKVTIRVEANDHKPATPNFKEYTLQFKQPTGRLSSLSFNNVEIANFQNGQFFYTVRGAWTEGCLTYVAEDGASTSVSVDFIPDMNIAMVTVAPQTAIEKVYYVKFAKEATAVDSKLLISLNGEFLGAPVQGVETSAPVTTTAGQTIDLQLLNFTLEGMGLIGDIFVTDIPYQENADGTVTLSKEQSIIIFGEMGLAISGEGLPLTLKGQINTDKSITADLTIIWNKTPIKVAVRSLATTSIDAKGVSKLDLKKARASLTNPNALIYADAGATNAAANDVVAGTCAELKLTDGHPFNAPEAFKATAVNYNRAFNTTANYVSSFVLPFAMDKAKVDGKVYQFAGVEGDYVNFTEVTEGMLAANTPYLIEATAANPFNHATDVQVAVTPATMQVANGDYAHVGTYTTQAVKSEGNTSYYGYANGAFVKANTGTLNPFRTMIKATVANAQAQFSLKLGNEVTGIIGVNSELGKVDVYNLEGKLIRNQVEATTALQGLAKGVYVINGKKVIK